MANIPFLFATPERHPDERREARNLGITGEQMATRYLEDNGFTILDRNYRKGHKEADIIALDGKEMVVVEVKTRSHDDVLQPEDAVDHRKRQSLIEVAHRYAIAHQRTEPIRFDIVAVISDGHETRIKHLRDAFNSFCY